MIIEHSFAKNYILIVALNSIYIIQAILVFITVITEHFIAHYLCITTAVFILILDIYLWVMDQDKGKGTLMRLTIIIGNLLVIYQESKIHNNPFYFEYNTEQVINNYLNSIMVISIGFKGVLSLSIFSKFRTLIEAI